MLTSIILTSMFLGNTDFIGKVTLGHKPIRNAVVFLDGYGATKPISGTIVQKNKAFMPHILVVPSGSRVNFPNMDAVYHNVFAEYNAKKFDLGMYPKGETRSVVFDKSGVVSVLCNVHPDMSAYIVVVNSTAYAMSDSTGKFTLKNVKPGNYKLQIWHESGAKTTESVSVGPGQAQSIFELRK